MNIYIPKDVKGNPLAVLIAECERDARIAIQGIYPYYEMEEIKQEDYEKNKAVVPVIRLLTSEINNDSLSFDYKQPILKR